MKKGIAIVIMLIVALSFALSGCGGGADDIATPDTGSTTEGTDTTSGDDTDVSDVTAAGEGEPQEGYLDEATGIYHTTLFNADNIPISFSVPDGGQIIDGLYGGGTFCTIWPTEGAGDDGVPGVFIQYNLSDESAQSVYDNNNENGQLGESQEVTYGSNTYISNVTPTVDGGTYFYYVGKTAPVVSIFTEVTDANRATLEGILSTLTY